MLDRLAFALCGVGKLLDDLLALVDRLLYPDR
jgi:hypothetical protein